MSAPRLKAGIFVRAHIRVCEVAGVFAVIARKGDETAGSVLLRINRLDGTGHLLSPFTHEEGGRAWRYRDGISPIADAVIDDMIGREIRRDPDLWVVEIEDRTGRHFLTEPVIG